MQKHFFRLSLLVSTLAFLPGCQVADWFKEKFGCSSCVTESMSTASGADKKIDSSEVVISIGGNPVVSLDDFAMSMQLLMQSQQGLMQILPMMPEEQVAQLVQQIAENLAAERVAGEWVRRQGIDKTPEYQQNARMIHEAVDRDLAARTFQAEVSKKVSISDADAKAYYDKNKDSNPYFKRAPFVQGTVSARASSVACSSEKEAKDLVAKVKNNDLNAAALEMKKTVKDLGTVTAQSDLDNAVKAKILGSKSAPAVEIVKGLDGKFYVVKVSSKQEPQAAPFDAVKESVKELMMAEKFQELFMQEIEKLKKEFGVTINQENLKKIVAGIKPAQPAQVEEAPEVEHAERPLKPLAA